MRRSLLPMVLTVCSACSACAPSEAPPAPKPTTRTVGELEGLTAAQALERVGVAPEAVATECDLRCAAFSVAGCQAIKDQCDDPDSRNIAVIQDGRWFTECPRAIGMACGGLAAFSECIDNCKAAHR